MNQNDFYAKIVKIIESCKTIIQLRNFTSVYHNLYFRLVIPPIWIKLIRDAIHETYQRVNSTYSDSIYDLSDMD